MAARYEVRAAVSHISVKLGAWTIYSFPFRIGHHFFLLVEINDAGQERIMEAIHGLATQYTLNQVGGQRACIASPLGTWSSQLKAYCITCPEQREDIASEWIMPYSKNYWIEPRETFPIYGQHANENDALSVWSRANQCIDTLNRANLTYSFCGFGKSLGLNCRNSNSVYATIAQYIGLKSHRFEGYRAPGLDTSLNIAPVGSGDKQGLFSSY